MFDMNPMRHIVRNGYHAIDWSRRSDLLITDLWQRFPELVVGKYLVNTSFDSGSLTLSEPEKEAGWSMVERLAHSPQIRSTAQIPHDQYDEWLVFDHPVQVKEFETMVNYGGFSPVAFDWEEKRERYWDQVLQLQPLNVIAENDGVYLLSRDENLITRILEAERESSLQT